MRRYPESAGGWTKCATESVGDWTKCDSDKEMRGLLVSTSNMTAANSAGNEKIEKRLDNLSGRFEKLEGVLIDRGASRQRSN